MKPETEYNEGDLIEAVKGDTVIRGRALRGVTGGLGLGEYTAAISYYVRQGFTLTVLEKASPPLPTEPGHYLDKDGDHWELPSDDELDPYYAPFTRLEPVPVTVQKVIEHIASSWEFGAPPYVASVLDQTAREFGVTE